MKHNHELEKALEDLNRVTGLSLELKAETDEEIENALTKLRNLSSAYKEKYNITHFFQNLLSGSIPHYAINDMALKLHIDMEMHWLVFLLKTSTSIDNAVIEVLKGLFPASSKNVIILMETDQIVLIHPVSESSEEDSPEYISRMIVDTLNAEALVRVQAAYSHKAASIEEIKNAYDNAQTALKIGSTFYSEMTIFSYDHLGIGQLIYELPKKTCEKFLKEVFRGRLPESFDEEMTHTINKFIQNNLNIAETSRQLHMHRNTLIYRLEQIQKHTGLDLRSFEDAMTFKIAVMVMNYLNTERIY